MDSQDLRGWLIYCRGNKGRIGVSPAAAVAMLHFIQDAKDKAEAGGVLLGRHLVDSDDVAVDQVTLPQPTDRRRRKSFVRRSAGHQEAVDEAWEDSGGSQIYLGEWHTHPEMNPEPSRTDRRGWASKVRSDMYGDGLFFIILGTEEMAIWEGGEDYPGPVRLKPHSTVRT